MKDEDETRTVADLDLSNSVELSLKLKSIQRRTRSSLAAEAIQICITGPGLMEL